MRAGVMGPRFGLIALLARAVRPTRACTGAALGRGLSTGGSSPPVWGIRPQLGLGLGVCLGLGVGLGLASGVRCDDAGDAPPVIPPRKEVSPPLSLREVEALLRQCSRNVRSVALVVGPEWQPSITVRLAVRCANARGLADALVASVPALAVVNPHGDDAQLRQGEPTYLQDDDGTVSVTVVPARARAHDGSASATLDVTYTRRGVRGLDVDEVRALAHALASTSASAGAGSAAANQPDDDDVPFDFVSVTMNEFFDAPTLEDAVRLLEDEFGARIEAGIEAAKRGGGGGVFQVDGIHGLDVNLPPLQHIPTEADVRSLRASAAAAKLQKLGATVYRVEGSATEDGDGGGGAGGMHTWERLAAADRVREEVEDGVLLPLLHPKAFERVAQATREGTALAATGNNLPRAVLFTGPPGTGKTTAARIIAAQARAPMVYVPLESVTSKWYGESERNMRDMAEATASLGVAEGGGRALLFIDELDALAGDRDAGADDGGGGMHEASRRILSVLLRQLDGIESREKEEAGDGVSGGGRVMLIGASNRPQDLDKALLSRFDVRVRFDLPDEEARAGIFNLYARHLAQYPADRTSFAQRSEGLSGRAILDVCNATERSWVARSVRDGAQGPEGSSSSAAPPIQEYLKQLERYKHARLGDY